MYQNIDKNELQLKAKLTREHNNFRNFSNSYFKTGRPQEIDSVTQAILTKNSTLKGQQIINMFSYEPYLTNSKNSATAHLNEVPGSDQKIINKKSREQSRQLQTRTSGYASHLIEPSENLPRSQTACIPTVISQSKKKALQKYFKETPNVEFISNTWDCQHLDQFVKSQKNFDNNAQHFQSRIISSSSQKHLTSISHTLLDKTLKQGQFSTITRFPENINQKNDFPSNYSTQNFLVTQRPPLLEAKTYFSQNFTVKEKDFDDKKLEFYKQPITLAKPSKKLEELKLVKRSQVKFKEWKTDILEKNKRYKAYKWEFPSGIIGIDNPMNKDTELYKMEYSSIAQRDEMKKQYQIQRAEQLKQLQKTNQEIEFFNKQNKKQKCEVIKIDPQWKNKAHIKEQFMEKYNQTHSRIFGQGQPEKINLQRTQNIIHNETKGKNFDIISYASYNPLS